MSFNSEEAKRSVIEGPCPPGDSSRELCFLECSQPREFRGGGGLWTRQTGAICQICVLTRKRCIFGAQKAFLPTMFVSKCYKTKDLAKIHFLTRSQNLEGKNTIDTMLKWGKGRDHYENHDLGHNH